MAGNWIVIKMGKKQVPQQYFMFTFYWMVRYFKIALSFYSVVPLTFIFSAFNTVPPSNKSYMVFKTHFQFFFKLKYV